MQSLHIEHSRARTCIFLSEEKDQWVVLKGISRCHRGPLVQSMCVGSLGAWPRDGRAPGGKDSHGQEESEEGGQGHVVLGQEQTAFVGTVLDKNQSLVGHPGAVNECDFVPSPGEIGRVSAGSTFGPHVLAGRAPAWEVSVWWGAHHVPVMTLRSFPLLSEHRVLKGQLLETKLPSPSVSGSSVLGSPARSVPRSEPGLSSAGTAFPPSSMHHRLRACLRGSEQPAEAIIAGSRTEELVLASRDLRDHIKQWFSYVFFFFEDLVPSKTYGAHRRRDRGKQRTGSSSCLNLHHLVESVSCSGIPNSCPKPLFPSSTMEKVTL